MDELNNQTDGQHGDVNPSSNVDSISSSNGESHGAPARPPARTITSKRVVIPPSAKRSAKPAAPPAPDTLSGAPLAASAAVATNGDAPLTIETTPDVVTPAALDSAPTEFPPPPSGVIADTTPHEPDQSHPGTIAAATAAALTQPVVESSVPETPPAVADTTDYAYAGIPQWQEQTTPPELRPAPIMSAADPIPTPASAGLKPSGLPYTPTTQTYPEIAQKQGRRRGLELALWGIAAILLVAAIALVLYFVFPDTLGGIAAPQASVSPTAVVAVQPTTGLQATTTLLPTPAATAEQIFPTSVPLIIPTPPVDGNQSSLLADAALTGWYASGEQEPHYGEDNLHAGTFQGKNLASVLQFNLRNLPQDTKILYAAVELTGRDGSRLGSTGGWQLDLVENSLEKDWFATTPEQLAAAATLGTFGGEIPASELGAGRLNRFILNETERQALEQQFKNGNAVFRLRGPASSQDNLFTWESGASGSALNAPTLHLVYVPGKYVIVTNTPEPENVLTAAAYVVRGTDRATRVGTPTRFPPGVATATSSVPTLVVAAETAIPGNAETAVARAQLATAVARTTGTYTPTQPFVILYPTLTPVVIDPGDLATATPIPPDTDLLTVPINYEQCQCQGRIMLLSNRYGGEKGSPIMINPDGSEVGKLSGDLYYLLALAREPYSPDRTRQVIYPLDSKGVQQIGYRDLATNQDFFLTNFPKGIAYDASWSPDGSAIAFISTELDNADEMWVYDFNLEKLTKIIHTPGGQPWFKRPTWSPDSQQIAYWSSVGSSCPNCGQIWIVNRDGSDPINISNNSFDERDPVWVE